MAKHLFLNWGDNKAIHMHDITHLLPTRECQQMTALHSEGLAHLEGATVKLF